MIPPPDQPQNTWHYSSLGWEEISNRVISETNVTLSVNGEEWLTFACTPTNLEALAVGFLFNEGFIRHASEIAMVTPCDSGCNMDVWLNKSIERPKQWRRTSGCTGGVTSDQTTTLSIEHAHQLGITLVGYARRNQFSIYTHPERVFNPTARLA